VIGPTLALLGLGIILTASTLVWMISVRLEDASARSALIDCGAPPTEC